MKINLSFRNIILLILICSFIFSQVSGEDDSYNNEFNKDLLLEERVDYEKPDFSDLNQLYNIYNEIMYWHPNVNKSKAYRKATLIYDYSLKYDVHPYLSISLAVVESNVRQGVKSEAGAIGIFQLMPETASLFNSNPYNLEENIEGGIKYFSHLLERYNCPKLALAHYNGGSNPEYKKNHYPETRNHVNQVMYIYEALKGRH